MSKTVGFYKDDEGRTRPITKPKKKTRYSGQTSDSSWKESSVEDVKERGKKPMPKRVERPIVYGGTPIEYEEVREGYGNVIIKNGNGETIRHLERTPEGNLVDEQGNIVATKDQLVTMRKNMRFSEQKVYPGTREAQLLREGTGFASSIISGGMSAIITPDTLYEMRKIMETEGYKETVKTMSSIAPGMMAAG